MQAALQNLMSGRTVFVIAHRLSTVRRADRIVVLENGHNVSDISTHEVLMQRVGTYRRLYELQFAEAEKQGFKVSELQGFAGKTAQACAAIRSRLETLKL